MGRKGNEHVHCEKCYVPMDKDKIIRISIKKPDYVEEIQYLCWNCYNERNESKVVACKSDSPKSELAFNVFCPFCGEGLRLNRNWLSEFKLYKRESNSFMASGFARSFYTDKLADDSINVQKFYCHECGMKFVKGAIID